MSKKNLERYVFSLVGINLERVNQKYGIGVSTFSNTEEMPQNTTKIDDLEKPKKVFETISFLDESKRMRKCNVSMVDLNPRNPACKGGYKCYWCRNMVPQNVFPIGIPVRYIPNKAIKKYHSEITKDIYTISEPITLNKSKILKERDDPRIKIEPNNSYLTDGVVCSFNCMISFINDNKSDPLYEESEFLALQLYEELHDQKTEIIPAPHWRTLVEHGGHLTIEKFRDTFNKIEYVDYGIISSRSIGRLYESRMKL